MKMYYPIFLNVEGKPCLVVGGGQTAERKVEALLECGASVRVIAPSVGKRLKALDRAGRMVCMERAFEPGDTAGMMVVIAATNDRTTNERVAAEAKRSGILCNVVDAPDLCSFIVPSVVRRGALTMAISTGGKSPALARKIREELEEEFGEEYGELLELLGSLRETVRARCPDDPRKRGMVFHRLVRSDVLDLLREGKRAEARQRIEACLSSLLD